MFKLIPVRLSLHPIKPCVEILFTVKGVKIQSPCAKEKTDQEVSPFVIFHTIKYDRPFVLLLKAAVFREAQTNHAPKPETQAVLFATKVTSHES